MTMQDLFDKEGVDYLMDGHHHCRSGWIQLDCPQCSPNQKAYRLGYPIGGRIFSCWACGRYSLRQALAAILRRPGVGDVLRQLEFPLSVQDHVVRVNGTLQPPRDVRPLMLSHRKYLERRNFDPDILERFWGVQGIGPLTRDPWRLYIPVHYKGEVVSFTTRALIDDGLRYKSAAPSQEKVFHKSLLYGEDFVPADTVIVVEGPFDVFRIGVGAVSCFGTSFTMAQVERILKYRKRYVCFDNQPDAQRQAKELCKLLSAHDGETCNLVIDAKDPGEAGDKETNELRALLAG